MPLSPLKLRTNILIRRHKDIASYLKEAEQQQQRIDKLINENADEADVRKQKEVLNETENMIPLLQKDLITEYNKLKTLLEMPDRYDEAELVKASDTLRLCDKELAVYESDTKS